MTGFRRFPFLRGTLYHLCLLQVFKQRLFYPPLKHLVLSNVKNKILNWMDYDPIWFNTEIPMIRLNKYRTLIFDHWTLTHIHSKKFRFVLEFCRLPLPNVLIQHSLCILNQCINMWHISSWTSQPLRSLRLIKEKIPY